MKHEKQEGIIHWNRADHEGHLLRNIYSYETAIRRNHLLFGIACQRISDDHKRKYSNESKIALVNIFMPVGYDRLFCSKNMQVITNCSHYGQNRFIYVLYSVYGGTR